MTIRKYLTNTVSIVHVTVSRGVRSETVDEDIPAFVATVRRIQSDATGDHVIYETEVFLNNDITILDSDEIIADGVQRGIKTIRPIKNPRTNKLHHIEVILK